MFSAYLSTIGLSLDEIGRVLRRAAEVGLLVLVHAEDNEMIDAGIAEQVRAGRLGPRGHADSRSSEAEASAIRSISKLAGDAGARVFFVHVSSAAGAEAVRQAREAGWDVNGETCVQYLFLDDRVYDRSDGELWICSPPIRSRRDQDALWAALSDGTLDLVSTDHNCFDRAQKLTGRGDFRSVPNGLPGVQLRLPILIGAVTAGRLSWEELARLAAEMPARLFGLWPRKGAIAEGADADLVLVDPAGSTDLGTSRMATDYCPLEGLTARGSVSHTWLRGRCIVDAGRFVGERGYGRAGAGPRAPRRLIEA